MDEEHRRYHEVANIFPLMTGADYDALKADIAEHGLREPIWLHSDGSIIDGRNRHRACIETGTPPRFETWNGCGSLVAFVVSLNLHRRHLDTGQQAMIGLRVKDERAKEIAAALPDKGREAAERQWYGPETNGEGLIHVDQTLSQPRDSLAEAAEIVGVGKTTMIRAQAVARGAPDLAAKVAAGEMKLSDAYREVRKQETETKKQEIIAKYDQVDGWTGALNINTISCASIYDLELPPESVDMVFTDPPYHDEHINLYERLAIVAERALKPGGYLLAYAGKMFIPQIIACLSARLEYVSIFAVFQPFSQARIMKHNIFENWRPILVFKKPGKSAVKEWAQDVVRGTRDKSHHDWQQDSEAPLQYIAAYTKPGDVVLDPFSGGGTTAWACKQLGRYFVAFDVDDTAVKLSMERVFHE